MGLMHQTSSVLQITPTCQQEFLEIEIQSNNLNLWTTNLRKWMKTSLLTKMDSKHHQVCSGLQPQREQQETGEAQGLVPNQPREDPLAKNWPMFGPNCKLPNFKRQAECRISTRMQKHSSRRPSMATLTRNNQSFNNNWWDCLYNWPFSAALSTPGTIIPTNLPLMTNNT